MAKPLLIAEIGGSSSRWAWVPDEGPAITVPLPGRSLPGFNPVNGDARLFVQDLREGLEEHVPAAMSAEHLVVYGAGCGSEQRRDVMHATIATIWPAAEIEVNTDLMGAARGLCGSGSGLVLILGTGMNAGWYDGGRLHQPMPSLGYVLGDEGSGADIGRVLLQDAFYRRMPEHVRTALFGPDGPSADKVIDEVHRSPFPARALAARTALLAGLITEPYVRELILSRFHALMEILKPFFPAEQRGSVHATGSVAWGFRELLSNCLLDHGMELTVVERDPLQGLVRWHQR
ncbi:MAG: hypothetical protein IPL52_00545 [Flavobacteriales bacterium]|nr:hypothetical protein [Flavobacteriales bacterium]